MITRCFEYSEHKLFKISVLDVTAEAVGVAIAAPPSEGEANAELCRYLSKVLEVKKSEVILEKVLFFFLLYFSLLLLHFKFKIFNCYSLS